MTYFYFPFMKKNIMFCVWFSFLEKVDNIKKQLWVTNIYKSRQYKVRG